MRGFSILEILVALAIISISVSVITVPEKLWEKNSVIFHLKTARFVSFIKRQKIRLICQPKMIRAHTPLVLHGCRVQCSPIVFHPSGFVTPAGHLLLNCGSRMWKITVSPLGRIRILELRPKQAMGNKKDYQHNNPCDEHIPFSHTALKGLNIGNNPENKCEKSFVVC